MIKHENELNCFDNEVLLAAKNKFKSEMSFE